jgi:hypothetical protein
VAHTDAAIASSQRLVRRKGRRRVDGDACYAGSVSYQQILETHWVQAANDALDCMLDGGEDCWLQRHYPHLVPLARRLRFQRR